MCMTMGIADLLVATIVIVAMMCILVGIADL